MACCKALSAVRPSPRQKSASSYGPTIVLSKHTGSACWCCSPRQHRTWHDECVARHEGMLPRSTQDSMPFLLAAARQHLAAVAAYRQSQRPHPDSDVGAGQEGCTAAEGLAALENLLVGLPSGTSSGCSRACLAAALSPTTRGRTNRSPKPPAPVRSAALARAQFPRQSRAAFRSPARGTTRRAARASCRRNTGTHCPGSAS
eukprot:1891972-Rhodomonas_salina.1